MSETENRTAAELEPEQLEQASGGYARPKDKEGYFVYQIKKGERLYDLAKRFCCTVEDILLWNPKITDRNKIYAGDYLYIRK